LGLPFECLCSPRVANAMGLFRESGLPEKVKLPPRASPFVLCGSWQLGETRSVLSGCLGHGLQLKIKLKVGKERKEKKEKKEGKEKKSKKDKSEKKSKKEKRDREEGQQPSDSQLSKRQRQHSPGRSVGT
jgi:hypothetical protein